MVRGGGMTRRELLQVAALAAAPVSRRAAYALLDADLIEDSSNVQLAMGRVRKDAAPLFGEDRPWEVRMDNVYANVLYDTAAGLYRCWYSPFIQFNDRWDGHRWQRSGAAVAREMAVCYAESRDGAAWRKPDLGLVEWEGARRNNIVWRGPHGSGMFRDHHETDPSRRYKMFFNQPDASGARHLPGTGMRVAFSSDGFHWSPAVSCTAIDAIGDTHNNAFWDERSGRYVAYTRLWHEGPDRQRIVGRAESSDFLHWTKAEEVLRGDTGRQAYAMPVFPHAHGYLGLLMIFDIAANTVDCELAWSRDTRSWKRVLPGTALIPRGPEGSHDHGCIFGAAYPIRRAGELVLYYGGNDRGHNGPRKGFFCRARLRPDGYAGAGPVEAGSKAIITTRPVTVSGRRLRITADAGGGSVRAGIVDAEDFSLERCRPVAADVTDAAVEWRGADDLGRLAGRRVRLRFELSSASLYTFSFTD
jgi:hypothetical protein